MQDFKKKAVIGEGSHAQVFLVENDQGEQRALKVYKPTKDKYEEMKRNFLVEASTLLKVSSPNIVKLYDFSVEEDSFNLLMEYCPYGSLKFHLEDKGAAALKDRSNRFDHLVGNSLADAVAGAAADVVEPCSVLQGRANFGEAIGFTVAKRLAIALGAAVRVGARIIRVQIRVRVGVRVGRGVRVSKALTLSLSLTLTLGLARCGGGHSAARAACMAQ